MNDITIVLIPMKAKPEKIYNLRPITFCNVVYKIIANVLANILRTNFPLVISEAQSVFIPVRLITNNILIAYEVNHYLKQKLQGKNGFVALKMDMSKAYDRMEWPYQKHNVEAWFSPILGYKNHDVCNYSSTPHTS